MAMSRTTGLPNQTQYAGEKSFVPWVIMSVSLSSRAEVQDLYSAKGMDNLFKFERTADFSSSPLGRTQLEFAFDRSDFPRGLRKSLLSVPCVLSSVLGGLQCPNASPRSSLRL